MYRKIKDFVTDWKVEQDSTVKIFSKISDDKLLLNVSDNTRSLGRLAWHITQTLTEMPSKAGIIENDTLENVKIPATMSEIIDAYKEHSGELMKLLQENWSDESLSEKINVYGQDWEKRKILSVLITHQIHHRAQMTVLMRLLGIPVPGIYGPSKEEWTQYGMTPQE
jgi:uncharacterized damage-inducible protein DinB